MQCGAMHAYVVQDASSPRPTCFSWSGGLSGAEKPPHLRDLGLLVGLDLLSQGYFFGVLAVRLLDADRLDVHLRGA